MFVPAYGEFVVQAFVSRMWRKCGYWGSRRLFFVRMNLQRLRYAYLDGVHWAVLGPGQIASVIQYVDCQGDRWVGKDGIVCIT